MEDINKLLDEARYEIGDFCIDECRAYCCRKGYLILSPAEVELIVGPKFDSLTSQGFLEEKWNGKFSLNLSGDQGHCPQLDSEFKCKIHKNPLRPSTCKDFPIFVIDKKIKISNRCPAKKAGKFYLFEKKAIYLGYEIVDELF